jgi:molybdate transport system substrate-binding protein
MAQKLTGISSMATRQVLADLVAAYAQHADVEVAIESVGGVDAARRVRAGELFDVVVLASDAIDALIAEGRIVARSKVDVVRSGVAIAVRAGAARPDVGTEDAVRQAVQSARSIGYSTGPSGVQLARLFERWGIAAAIKDRIVTAPPGVPVGSLVAAGEVELGFQQLSELMHLPGITVVGPLPPGVQTITTFAGGVAATSVEPEAVRDLLKFLAGPAAAAQRRLNGMEAAD